MPELTSKLLTILEGCKAFAVLRMVKDLLHEALDSFAGLPEEHRPDIPLPTLNGQLSISSSSGFDNEAV